MGEGQRWLSGRNAARREKPKSNKPRGGHAAAPAFRMRPVSRTVSDEQECGMSLAESTNDPERRADLLGFGRLWMSLTEPIGQELRGQLGADIWNGEGDVHRCPDHIPAQGFAVESQRPREREVPLDECIHPGAAALEIKPGCFAYYPLDLARRETGPFT